MINSRVKTTAAQAVAIAIAGVALPSMAATTAFNVASAPRYIGTEAAAVAAAADSAAVYGLPEITIVAGSNSYINGDVVTLTISGATLRSGADLGTITCTTQGTATGSMKWVYNATTSSGNTIKLDVADRAGVAYDPATGDGLNCKLPVDRIKVLASSVTSPTQVTMTMSAGPASGSTYDTLVISSPAGLAPQSSVAMAFSTPQFALTPAPAAAAAATIRHPATGLNVDASTVAISTATGAVPFNNTIGSSSTSFAGAGAGAAASESATTLTQPHNDVLRYVVRNEQGAAGYVAAYATNAVRIDSTGDSLIHTFTGDFTFLDDDANGCTAADLAQGANTVVTEANNQTGLVISSDCQTITRTSTYDGTNRDTAYELRVRLNGFVPGVAGSEGSRTGRAISARAFGLSVGIKDAADAAAWATVNPTAGSWVPVSTGSSSANIPYVPYGAGISRIMYVTNTGSVGGVASFSATGPTGTACASTNFGTVSVPAGSVVNVGGLIDAGVRACFPTIDADSGKVNVNVSVRNATSTSGTAPTIEFSSAYNVSGNRNVVINSTN